MESGSRRLGLPVRIQRESPDRRGKLPPRGIPMHRSSGQNRFARRPALEQCEHRILQSIAAGPTGVNATQSQVTASAPAGSPTAVVYKPALDHASAIFDDPFFFDPN